MKQTDKAIFLHRINYSESSLITTFFTFQHGLQKFIFQGGRKKPQALFPMSLLEITFYKRPDSELGKLTDATPYEQLFDLQINPLKSTISFFMADVVLQCLQHDHQDKLLFNFLETEMFELNNATEISLNPVLFLLKLTKPLGIEPDVEESNKKYFYYEEGEFSDIYRPGELVESNDAIQLIQNLLRNENLEAQNKTTRQAALDILLKYYSAHIPKFNVSKSLTIIQQTLE